MLLLTRPEVESLLDLDALIAALAPAMADLSAGRASMPPRVAAWVPERRAFLAAMPARVPGVDALTVKLVSVFPENADRPTHQAVVLAFDPETGTPVAMMDGTAITALRTAAGSALATRLLAREDASVLAILGTGVQARAHARAIPLVRPIREVRVAGRNPDRAASLAGEVEAALGVPVRAAGSWAEALDGADVACAATHATEPVVRRAWLPPGIHVNSVGYNPEGREVDGETVRDALVVVESREAALAPVPAGSPDLARAIREGLVTEDHIHTEVGELVAGTKAGRTSPDQITLYKSVGVAVQDAAAAALVLAAARERGVGREVEV